MSSLKNFLVQAILRVTENPKYAIIDFDTRENARDFFIQAVVAELFPDESAVTIPVAAAPAEAPAKPKKTKKTDEEKEAEKKAKEEAKEAEKKAKEAEKKAKEEAKEAEKKAKEEAKPKKAAKAAAPAENVNLAKMDPTWRKALREADKEHAKELEPQLLLFVNAMTNVGFNSRGVKEHVADFLATRAAGGVGPAPAEDDADMGDFEEIEFRGTTYYVIAATKRVYEGEMDEDGNLKVTRPVGYVGMAEFKDMVIPE